MKSHTGTFSAASTRKSKISILVPSLCILTSIHEPGKSKPDAQATLRTHRKITLFILFLQIFRNFAVVFHHLSDSDLQFPRVKRDYSPTENMCKTTATLIVNPISGTRSKRGLEDFVRDRMEKHGMALDIRHTTGSGDATRFAHEAAQRGCPLVIVAGGDGTVNETASGICGTSTALGIIPLGSGNGLARSLGIPQDVKSALEIIIEGKSMCIDHGVADGHNFFCTFGLGFDAKVSEEFAHHKRRGKTTYIISVIHEFLKYQPEAYAISIGGRVITERAFLIAVCNATQYGNNAYIAPNARLDDGLLDMIVVHSSNPLKNMTVGVDLLTGYLDRNTLIDSFRISEATITRLKEGPAHVDGDPITLGKKIEIACRPASLWVMVPEKTTRFRPIITPLSSAMSDLAHDLASKFPLR